MQRFVSALSMLAVAGFAAACTSDEGGTALATRAPTATGGSSATTPTTSGSVSPGSPTADLDPCALLSKEELAELATFNDDPQAATQGGARVCSWRTMKGSSVMSVALGMQDNQGISDVQDGGLGVDTVEVNGRQLARIPMKSGGCIVAIGVGDSSRVDVRANSGFDTQQSCELADKAAAIVEPKLPEG